LEVDDDGENNDGREQAHDIWEPLPPEGLAQRTTFIMPREQEVEHGNDSTFEFGSRANVGGGGGEGLPEDKLADVVGDEHIAAGSETVAFLNELVEEDDDEGGDDKSDRRQTPAPSLPGWAYNPLRT